VETVAIPFIVENPITGSCRKRSVHDTPERVGKAMHAVSGRGTADTLQNRR